MSQLNEYECEMLDALLEAFGVPDMLTRRQVMDLFGQDEATAFQMVQVLLREDLVAERGEHGNYDLPEKLILKPKGDKLLRSGGFMRLYHEDRQEPTEIGSTLSNLQQEGRNLANQRLLDEMEIKGLKRKVKLLYGVIIFLLLLLAGAVYQLMVNHGK